MTASGIWSINYTHLLFFLDQFVDWYYCCLKLINSKAVQLRELLCSMLFACLLLMEIKLDNK